MRPVLQRLNKNFLDAAEIEPCLAVDEMIIPFKGRHSLKVYMMKKQKKSGAIKSGHSLVGQATCISLSYMVTTLFQSRQDLRMQLAKVGR